MAGQDLKRMAWALLWGLLSPVVWGGDAGGDWRVEKRDDGIAVFSRPVAGSSLRAVRAETDIHASFAQTVDLLLDPQWRPRWDENCADAFVHRQVSAVEDIIYVHNNLPWPISDRDMVLRRQWSIAADGTHAQIRAKVTPGVLPEVAGRVRVPMADGVWTVTRKGEAGVHVVTEIHADPGGPIPDRLMNALSVNGPYKALASLRQLLESGGYPSRPEG